MNDNLARCSCIAAPDSCASYFDAGNIPDKSHRHDNEGARPSNPNLYGIGLSVFDEQGNQTIRYTSSLGVRSDPATVDAAVGWPRNGSSNTTFYFAVYDPECGCSKNTDSGINGKIWPSPCAGARSCGKRKLGEPDAAHSPRFAIVLRYMILNMLH